jgi:hypothetical protein
MSMPRLLAHNGGAVGCLTEKVRIRPINPTLVVHPAADGCLNDLEGVIEVAPSDAALRNHEQRP